jgi:hypothetical protein
MSGATGTAGGVATTAEDRCWAPWPGDGTHLQADRFRLLGVSYAWLTASITTFSVIPTTQIQQLQGQFDAGRSHHRSLHGTFTVTRAVARGRSRAARWSGPIHEVLRHGFLQRGPFLTSHGSGRRFGPCHTYLTKGDPWVDNDAQAGRLHDAEGRATAVGR